MADRNDEALAAARLAAEKKESARFRSRPAWVLYHAKRYDEARKAYAQLIADFDADHASDETRDVMRDARLSLSNLSVLGGDEPAAEEWLEQVLDEFPDDVGAMNDLGYLWADANKHLDRAERMIRQAVAAEPDNAAYRDSLGWVLFRLGKYPEAVAELKKAAADKTIDGTVMEHLGDAYAKLNRRPDALKAWRQAAAAFRKEKETQKAEAVEKKTKES
jgi:Tfp pilus assembly protein PilF